MIDRFFVLALALLVLGNFAGALASTIDWPRVRHWHVVHWRQLDAEDRAVIVWMGRTAWVMVLLGTAML